MRRPTCPSLAAWNVALCYSLQLYFDFSGYSDMAIGLARMFNVRFPLNFNSPYKAASVIDHWQRWHMTLSRYLALYLYNPIALGSPAGAPTGALASTAKRQATFGGFAAMVMFPTIVTMGLGRHMAWRRTAFPRVRSAARDISDDQSRISHLSALPAKTAAGGRIGHCSKVLLTYLSVLVASVFFRAPSVQSAMHLLQRDGRAARRRRA